MLRGMTTYMEICILRKHVVVIWLVIVHCANLKQLSSVQILKNYSLY